MNDLVSSSVRHALGDVGNLLDHAALASARAAPRKTPTRQQKAAKKQEEEEEHLLGTPYRSSSSSSSENDDKGDESSSPKRKHLKFGAPDMLLLENNSHRLAKQESEIKELMALVNSLRREKTALSTKGPQFYATVLQRYFRGCLGRRLLAVALPQAVRLESFARFVVHRARYTSQRRSALRLQTRFRSRRCESAYELCVWAAIQLQTVVARARPPRVTLARVKCAAVVAQSQARGLICRNRKCAALSAATKIAKVYRSFARRSACLRRRARHWRKSQRTADILNLLLRPPQNAVLFTVPLEALPDSCIESKLLPDQQPFAIKLRIDADGDLGVFFVMNPRRDIRLILAPWVIRGDISITIHNQEHKAANATFKLDHESLVLARNACFIQKLIPAAKLPSFFSNGSSLVITVLNTLPAHSSGPGQQQAISCFAHNDGAKPTAGIMTTATSTSIILV